VIEPGVAGFVITVMLAPVAVVAVVEVRHVPPLMLISQVMVWEPVLSEVVVYVLEAPL
jgi:hypothetical protein